MSRRDVIGTDNRQREQAEQEAMLEISNLLLQFMERANQEDDKELRRRILMAQRDLNFFNQVRSLIIAKKDDRAFQMVFERLGLTITAKTNDRK